MVNFTRVAFLQVIELTSRYNIMVALLLYKGERRGVVNNEFDSHFDKNILLLDTANAPGGVMAYYADGEEEIIHANQYVIEMCSCSTYEEFLEHTKGSFRGFVHADELERVEEAIWMQVQERSGFDHVFYHIVSKSGRLISIDDYGRLVEQEGERPIFYVFLAEVDRQEAHDWLTGLPELPHFKHLAALETLSPYDVEGAPTIVVFDLMGMKNYNATYGRKGGDELLRGFANVLRRHFNPEACCRHAGDRFFAFAPSYKISERIQAVFDDFAASGIQGVLPVMTGVCSFTPGDDVSTVLDRARLACDSDNKTWSSHITWFSEEMRADAELRVYILEHLDNAIENRWLHPYYQAIMRSTSDHVCCEEALARWVDPKYGLLSPGIFIPVLERAGLLYKLDMHILDCVLEDLIIKKEYGTPITPVSINISLKDFGKLDVAHEIVRKVEEAGISPRLIKVEFTESAATSSPEQLRAQIQILHKAGFSVWADDFGSGYSSLSTLGGFDFDLLKLDMELVRNLKYKRSRGIVAGVVQVARKLGIGTLAEGVETPEQMNYLKSIGCGMLQGFYYTEPKPLNVIQRNAREGRGMVRESLEEFEYWNKISLFELDNPISNSDDWSSDDNRILEFPAAIIEHRGNRWSILRANEAYENFLVQTRSTDSTNLKNIQKLTDDTVDPDFQASISKSLKSGTWERVAGQLEYGTGLQFFTKHIASTTGADAFVNASISAMLGSALGAYGDIPVAYAVFKVMVNASGDAIDDMEFVYANDEYCSFMGAEQSNLPGQHFIELFGDRGSVWLPYCYRAAVLKEKVHDVIFDEESGHWVSFNIAPASIEGCCSFVFTTADDERHMHMN